LRHFENALNIGTPGCDANLLTTARFKEQRSQIQARRLDILDLNKYKLSKYNHIKIENNSSHIDAVLFFSEKEGDRKKSIDLLHSAMVSSFPSDNIPSINWTAIEFESKHFYFLHFDNDYIPKKIADTGKFYEQHFLIMLGRLHHPGRLVVDCGANIGNHTIYFSGVLKASVVSFEPQPYNRFFLDANRVLNGLEELIYVKNVALGRAKGCVELQMAIDGNYGSFTSDMRNIEKVREVEASCDKYTVNVSTIDDELASCKSSISIIKIDVEGMELDVLKGAKEVIQCSKPVIAVECFTKSIFNEINEYLKSFGYFVLDSHNATPTFIFINQYNSNHIKKMSEYLKFYSTEKFNNNSKFNK
jgi:FkbM family methyltransferase